MWVTKLQQPQGRACALGLRPDDQPKTMRDPKPQVEEVRRQ